MTWQTPDESSRALVVLADVAAKGLVVLLVAALASALLRRSAAAVRHLVWSAALAGLVALPAMSLLLPGWQAPILPAAKAPPGLTAEVLARSAEAPAIVPREFVPAVPQTPAAPDNALPQTVEREPLPAAPLPRVEPMPAPAPAATPVTAAPAASARRAIGWTMWVLIAWLAGVLAVAVPFITGTLAARLAAGRATPLVDAHWLTLLGRLQDSLRIRRPVRLLQGDRSSIPFTWGLLRPVIMLPAECDAWTDARRRAVLLHELAHIKRGDCLTQFTAHLALVLHWFNPLAWLAVRVVRVERERACDDLVLSAGMKPSDYAGHLLDIVRTLRSARFPSLAAVAMARKSQFEGRMRAILDPRRSRRAMTRWIVAAVAVLVAGVIVPVACMRATTRESANNGAGAQQGTPFPPGKDANGDALPEGAIARLGTLRYRMPPREPMYPLQFTADDSTVRSGPTAWDVATGSLRHALPLPEGTDARFLAASPDTKLVLYAEGHGDAEDPGTVLSLRQMQSGQVLRRLESYKFKGTPGGAVFSADGKYLAVIDVDQTVGGDPGWGTAYSFSVWEVGSGRRLFTKANPVTGSYPAIGGLAFSPDEKRLGLAGADGVMRLYGLPNGEVGPSCDTKVEGGYQPCFIDANTLCVGQADGIRVWKLSEPAAALWEAKERHLYQVAISPDHKYLAAASWYGPLVYEAANGRLVLAATGSQPDHILSVAFSHDGRLLAVGREQSVEILSVGDWKPAHAPEAHVVPIEGLAVSADGRTIVTAENRGLARVWDERGAPIRAIGLAEKQGLTVAISPDGRTLATPLGLWDIATGALRVRYETDARHLLRFVDTGSRILEVGEAAIGWRDVATGKLARTLRPADGKTIACASLSADGRTLVWSENNSNGHVYDMASGRETARYQVGPRALGLSPDGRRLAIGEEIDYTLRPARPHVTIRDTATGAVQQAIRVEPGYPSLLQWSPDGKWLAAEYRDGIIRIYETGQFHEVGTLRGHTGDIERLCWFADGRRLASVGTDTTGLIWDTATLKAATRPATAPNELDSPSLRIYRDAEKDAAPFLAVDRPEDGDAEFMRMSAEELLAYIVQWRGATGEGDRAVTCFMHKTADRPDLRSKIVAELGARVKQSQFDYGSLHSATDDKFCWIACLAKLGAHDELVAAMEREPACETCCGWNVFVPIVVSFGRAEDAWTLVRKINLPGGDGSTQLLNGALEKLTGHIMPLPQPAKWDNDSGLWQARELARLWTEYLNERKVADRGAPAFARGALPGSQVKPQPVFSADSLALAVMDADERPMPEELSQGGRLVCAQTFTVKQTLGGGRLLGSGGLPATLRLTYRCAPGERPIAQGEIVVWIISGIERVSNPAHAGTGIRAFANSEEGRKTAADLLKAATTMPAGGPGKAVLLPGTETSLTDAMKARPVVALCEITEPGGAVSGRTGYLQSVSKARIIEVLAGKAAPGDVRIRYAAETLLAERLIEKGEKLIWLLRPSGNAGEWEGTKALADMPANREMVALWARYPAARAEPTTMPATAPAALSIRGLVLDAATSKPVAGAQVAKHVFVPPGWYVDYKNAVATDAQGRFELHDVPREGVGVRDERHFERIIREDELPRLLGPADAGGFRSITITLASGPNLTGVVTDSQAKPLAGATVSDGFGKSATTDQRGRFTLHSPGRQKPDSAWHIRVEAAGFIAKESAWGLNDATIALEPEYALVVEAVTEADQRLADFEACVHYAESYPAKDGQVQMSFREPGQRTLWVRAKGYAMGERPVQIGPKMAPVVVTMTPGVTVRGKVKSAVGKKEDGEVRLRRSNTDAPAMWVRPDADGAFQFEHVGPGEFDLVASIKGATDARTKITVGDKDMDVPPLEARGTGTIVGQAFLPFDASRPWSNAAGSVFSEDRKQLEFRTDREGRFRVEGVTLGKAQVSIGYQVTPDLLHALQAKEDVRENQIHEVKLAPDEATPVPLPQYRREMERNAGGLPATAPATGPATEAHYIELYDRYKAAILKSVQAGDKDEAQRLTDEFNRSTGGRVLQVQVSRLEASGKWQVVVSKTYAARAIDLASIKYGSNDKPHVTPLSDNGMDYVLLETNTLPGLPTMNSVAAGKYADDVYIKMALAPEPPATEPAGFVDPMPHFASEDGKYHLRLGAASTGPATGEPSQMTASLQFGFAADPSEFFGVRSPSLFLDNVAVQRVAIDGADVPNPRCGAWPSSFPNFVTIHELAIPPGARKLSALDLAVSVVTVTQWQTLKFENLGSEKSDYLKCGPFELMTQGADTHFNVTAAAFSQFEAEHKAFGAKVPLNFLHHKYACDAVRLVDAAGRQPGASTGVTTGGASSRSFSVGTGMTLDRNTGKFIPHPAQPIAYPVTLTIQIPAEFKREQVIFKLADVPLALPAPAAPPAPEPAAGEDWRETIEVIRREFGYTPPATQPAAAPAYPRDGALWKGEPLKVPPEFRDGTATMEQAKAWAKAVLGDYGRTITTKEAELVPGGRKALFLANTSNAGTGGNFYLVLEQGDKGLHYLGYVAGFGRAVPPDASGRPRWVSYFRNGGGDGTATLLLLTNDGFIKLAEAAASGDDGAADDLKRVYESLFGEKAASQETLERIFGDPATQPAGAIPEAYRGLKPCTEADATQNAIRRCEAAGCTENRVISIRTTRTDVGYFAVEVQGKRDGRPVTNYVCIHKFSPKGDVINPQWYLRELAAPATNPATAPAAWSKPVNGLEARLFFKRVKVFNGTPIIATYVELRNVQQAVSPMAVPWSKVSITLRMADSAGQEVKPSNGPWSGPVPAPKDLVLPFGGSLSFDISGHGAGVPGDMAAMVDLGVASDWALPRDGKDYFLQATLEIPQIPRDPNDAPPWHGRLELPPVQVPTKSEALDPAKVGPLIEQLGAKMLGEPGTESEQAEWQLSLIDDPRVVPWYAKAVQSRYPSLKRAAVDRLARFNSDEALEGLKKAMGTQGTDIDYCTTAAVAAEVAQSIRYSVALALLRSPHPRAKQLLIAMQDDAYWPVRQTVLQALDRLPASLELIQKMTHDPDERVRDEALRHLKLREATTRPAP